MNLYKILFSHHGPKDNETGIKCLLLAENEEEVYNWIDSKLNYDKWESINNDEEGETYDIYDDKYDVIGQDLDYKTRVIRLNGDMYDDDDKFNGDDYYYGITLYGWKLIEENYNLEHADILMRTGILKTTQDEAPNN